MRKRLSFVLWIMAWLIPLNGGSVESTDTNTDIPATTIIAQSATETTFYEDETQTVQSTAEDAEAASEYADPKITIFIKRPILADDELYASGSGIKGSPPSPTEHSTGSQELISLGTFTLTAYCSCRKCCGQYAENRPVDENGNEIVYGSIGERLTAGVSIAVDPRVIPYWSQVVINGHTYIAHDTGGSIIGRRIDIYFDDHQEAGAFGTQWAEVFICG